MAVGRLRAVAAGAALLGVCLAGCSVPRERDQAGASSRAPSATVAAPAGTTASGAGDGLAVVPSAVDVAVPSASASPTVSPTVAPVRPPVPRRVRGYVLTAAPRSLGNPLAVVRGARDLFGAATARSVGRSGAPVGVLLLLALCPEYVGNRDIESMLVQKVVAGITSGGVKPVFSRWNGMRVAVAPSAKDGTIVVWYSRGVLGVVVGGAEPAVVSGYAKAYVASR
jgi:hypothetical protein